ncbi:MAG: MlaE family ABC transporter permease [Opitutales bacterium]
MGVRRLGAAALFGTKAFSQSATRDFSPRKILLYIYEIGLRTLPLVLMVGFFTGMVLGLQGYYTLVDFGSESLIGSLVALTVVREIGPVLTAIMVVGQAGSAMSAEIGVQRNTEQIDALQVMGIPPLSFLVGPRIIAAVLCFPLLTAFFNTIAIWGGYVSSVAILGVDGGVYLANVRVGIAWNDLLDSHLKAAIFGLLTVTVCCFAGYFTHEFANLRGARGVSQSATRAVVISSVLILFSDYLITSFVL